MMEDVWAFLTADAPRHPSLFLAIGANFSFVVSAYRMVNKRSRWEKHARHNSTTR